MARRPPRCAPQSSAVGYARREAFDRLTRTAAAALRATVSLITLTEDDRQFFKSCVGLAEPFASARETPLSHSFCQHVVATGEPLKGHEVEEAAEGGEALHLLDGEDYDVILSDLRMPGLGGEALLGQLRERGRADRLIFITGDAASADAERILQTSDVPVLLKPLPLEELARAVEARARGSAEKAE